jgi:ABC-type uncharacterized transport system substrate-binding protein
LLKNLESGALSVFCRVLGDLVGRQVAVIAAITLPSALAAKEATSMIPIVFIAAVILSGCRPGGNVTQHLQ